MKRLVNPAAVLGLCLPLILGFPALPAARPLPGPRAPGISYLPEVERAVFQLTNTIRQRKGLPPLAWGKSLGEVARAHSADMLARQYFSHSSPDGRSPHERLQSGHSGLSMSGENIWSGSGHDSGNARQVARLIVDSWLASPGHRQNLLSPDFTEVGVGVAARGREIRATQVFVRYRR